jgi:tetratricopeptide (TPR) repeat protein
MFKDILDALKAKAAFTALDRLARDFELTPHDSALQRAYGLALFDLGFAERALSALSPLLDSTRLDDPAITLVVGHCHSALGDIQQAATAYRALLNASQPDARSIAYWSLADLKQFRFTDVELTQLRQHLNDAQGTPQIHLAEFAMAWALDFAGDATHAFLQLQRANEKVAVHRQYPASQFNQQLADLERHQPSQARNYAPCATPLFIVGLPRSGSTLLEQLLASSPLITATHELPFVQQIAEAISAKAHPLSIYDAQFNAKQAQSLRDQYLQQAHRYLEGSTPFFIDKWLDNFWYAPLIFDLFPEARMLSVSRDIADNLIGLFRQYFGTGNAFAFDLKAALHYCSVHLGAMAKLQQQYPRQVMVLDYKRLVTETPLVMAQIAKFCGFEPISNVQAISGFSGSIMTPSGNQLRDGITTQYLNRSAQYSDGLAPFQTQIRLLENRRATLIGPR